MKHTILLFAGFLSIQFAIAQKIDESKVPAAVKSAFAKQYPSVSKVGWELEKEEYEASFKDGTESHSAVFKNDGTLVESEIEIKINDLPKTVLTYMREHYQANPIKEAAKITKADGTLNFEAAIKGKDILFDKDGKFIKEAKD